MNANCPRCQQDNPDLARFCGACGCALPTLSAGRPKRGNRGGLLVVVVILIGIWFFRHDPPRGIQKIASVWPRVVNRIVNRPVERTIDLDGEAAKQLYQLLAPQDVGVIVRWDGGRVDVRGSDDEVETLVGLAGMLARDDRDRHGFNRTMAMARARRDRVTTRYRLPAEKSRMLARLIKHADISLSVSTSSDTITIGASSEDHAVLKQVVSILNGERF